MIDDAKSGNGASATATATASGDGGGADAANSANVTIESLTPAGLVYNRVDFPPEPRFNKLSENLRTMTPPEMQCSVFCGGRRCRYENPKSWGKDDMALDGIYSHWITDNILAMARPSDDMVKNQGLPEKFLSAGIKSIVNLQTPGEHASCGPGLVDSGFTYDPNDFMAKGIFAYNFVWKDYGSRSLDGLLDIVKVVAFALGEGKVAIHCHAGLGRTGVLIACYLVYALRVRANDAIRYVRLKRANAVQTRGQILCVQEFAQFILPDLAVFCNRSLTKNKKELDFSLPQFLIRQKNALHGYESRVFRHLPKIVYLICERLIQLSEPSSLSNPTSRVSSGAAVSSSSTAAADNNGQLPPPPPRTGIPTTATAPSNINNNNIMAANSRILSFSSRITSSYPGVDEYAVSSKPFTNFFLSARVDAESAAAARAGGGGGGGGGAHQLLGIGGRAQSLGRSPTGISFSAASSFSLGSSAPSNLSSPSDTPKSGSPLWATGLGGSGDDDSASDDLYGSMLGGHSQQQQQQQHDGQKIKVASRDPGNNQQLQQQSTTTTTSNGRRQQADARLSPSGEVLPTCASGLSTIDDGSLDSVLGDGIRNQDLRENGVFQELSSQTDLRKNANQSLTRTLGPDEVFEALLADHDLMDDNFRRTLVRYRLELNYRQTAWDRLSLEEDARVLGGLLWFWLEHLKLPVLGREELSLIVITAENPEQCLRKLNKDSKYTLEYLVRFVARMRTLSDEQTECLLKRLAASLTHQGVPVRGILKPAGQFYGDVAGKGYTKLREGTQGRLLVFLQRLHDLVELNPLRPATASTVSSAATSRIMMMPSIPGSANSRATVRHHPRLGAAGGSLPELPPVGTRLNMIHGEQHNGLPLSDVAESPSGGSVASSASSLAFSPPPGVRRGNRSRADGSLADVIPPVSGMDQQPPPRSTPPVQRQLGVREQRSVTSDDDDVAAGGSGKSFVVDEPPPVGAPPSYDAVVAGTEANSIELSAT